MKRLLYIAAGMVFSMLAGGQAYAGPVCTNPPLNLGIGSGLAATLGQLSGGNCVIVGDKEFGSASVSGAISGTGSVHFTAPVLQGDVIVAFDGTVGPGATGTISYGVAIVPGLAGGLLIHDLQKDFTLSGATGTTATLSGQVTSSQAGFGIVNISCTRTIGSGADTCPVETAFATLVTDINVTQTLTTGVGATVTAITDRISQAKAPEPASLALLAVGLLGLGFVSARKRQG